tara:strand:- start:1385 stop:1957 length:573 start_codon:yes stop_codon:yes gene_type:complete
MKSVILDSGHGGIINGVYQTAGKRSPAWPDGTILYEGEFNRAVKARIIERLSAVNVPYIDISPEMIDISLNERVQRANKYDKNTFLVSIHANAGGGTGSEIFISPNASKTSKKIAEEAARRYERIFTGYKWRGIKEKEFTIIHKSKMPAVLFECFFMDNKKECNQILQTRTGRDRCAEWIYSTIIESLFF